MPESSSDLIDQLAQEFLAQLRAGESPSIEELAEQYPPLADQIRAVFPTLGTLEGLKPTNDDDATVGPELGSPVNALFPRIPDYGLFREIGRGGMGVVYEAEHIALGRRVALKVLPANLKSDPKAVQRFQQEARAAAAMHHSNIVPVFDVGSTDEYNYYAMQFIVGDALDRVIEVLREMRSGDDKSANKQDVPEDATVPHQVALALTGEWSLETGRGGAGGAPPASHDAGRRAFAEETGGYPPDPPRNLPDPPRNLPDPARNSVVPTRGLTDAARAELAGKDQDVLPSPLPDPPHQGEGGHAQRELDTQARASATTSNISALTGASAYARNVARIGVEVADALAHAHQRGIIHRDIKPSNILLDTDGQAWVADFGLAKSENVELTATGNILGTLRYMSPERFSGPCDQRGDVYGLGATLYEMLALRPLFDSKVPLSLVDSIKNETPKPLRELDAKIPRDLETIVNKAITKDPTRRYGSAKLLADDLQRFLDGKPIHARQVSACERLYLWARKNPAIATLLSALCIGLLAVTVAATVAAGFYRNLALREQAAVTLANDEAGKAALEAETKQSINDFLIGDILGKADVQANASDITLRQVLVNAAERIGNRFDGKPVVEGEIRRTIGRAMASLGRFAEGAEQLAHSHELLTEALGPQHAKTMQTIAELGRCYRDWEKPKQAELYTRQYYDYAVQQYGPDDAATMQAAHMLGMVVEELGKTEEAAELLSRSLVWRREEYGDSHPQTIRSIAVLGSLYLYDGKYELAAPLVIEAAELSKAHLGMENFATMICLDNEATLYFRQGKFEQAMPLMVENIRLAKERLGERHPGYVATLSKLSALQRDMGNLQESIATKKLEFEAELAIFGPDHPTLIRTYMNLGRIHTQTEQYDAAREYFEEGLALASRTVGDDHWDAQESRFYFAQLAIAEEQYTTAIKELQRVRQAAIAKFGVSSDWAVSALEKLCDAWELSEDDDAAEQALLAAEKTLRENGDRDAFHVRIVERLIQHYETTERPDEVRRWRGRLPQ